MESENEANRRARDMINDAERFYRHYGNASKEDMIYNLYLLLCAKYYEYYQTGYEAAMSDFQIDPGDREEDLPIQFE